MKIYIDEKIEGAKFKVGDIVVLKGHKFNSEKNYKSPAMVVKKVFFREHEQFSKKNGNKISDSGAGVQVSCTWFVSGKVEEKVFPEEVLSGVENDSGV